ncbi:hypothetical protein EVG20_g11232 [Dentipellis fragilis]|uniref:Uncharacterized protein n=1 Tax=Dentipellis fragilis TaxID=205917 RepID=A0A4Y9XL23_9AGAM|nr:hypothetical protein EVG20_g11232 [Dentipellis fragilis]
MSKSSSIREFELDGDGKLIPDVATGYRLTARSLEARRQRRISRLKGREPMEDLPKHLCVHPDDPSYRCPDRVQYGIPVTIYQLYDYAVARGLRIKNPYGSTSQRATFFTDLRNKVVADLGEMCRTTLHSAGILSVDYDCILALHDNYSVYDDELEDAEEQQVVEILQRALKTEEKPKWYFDVMPF